MEASTEQAGSGTAEIRLTQYSHGAGCGCKIAPAVLSKMLALAGESTPNANLLVGNDRRDDAAVFRLNEREAIVSTTDFFMPIVDDPFDFGAIASVNAISDIYAMGGQPMMAIAILGWPIDKLPPEVAGTVLAGARDACQRAGIPLAGGHSIDAPEPIFGLAVTGRVHPDEIKTNGGARSGDLLFLSKPLGVGLMSTAQKRGLLLDEDFQRMRAQMLELNDLGAELADMEALHALTDVTGFGLLGHLVELCEASTLTAAIDLDKVPRIEGLDRYLDAGTWPGGTGRNHASYGHRVAELSDRDRALLCDPQTSGGLLMAVDPDGVEGFLARTRGRGLALEALGVLEPAGELAVRFRKEA